MNDHQKLAVKAISCYMGDNYERASRAFRGMTDAQLDSQYGASGRTCREILDGYRRHKESCEAAIKWVEAQ